MPIFMFIKERVEEAEIETQDIMNKTAFKEFMFPLRPHNPLKFYMVFK